LSLISKVEPIPPVVKDDDIPSTTEHQLDTHLLSQTKNSMEAHTPTDTPTPTHTLSDTPTPVEGGSLLTGKVNATLEKNTTLTRAEYNISPLRSSTEPKTLNTTDVSSTEPKTLNKTYLTTEKVVHRKPGINTESTPVPPKKSLNHIKPNRAHVDDTSNSTRRNVLKNSTDTVKSSHPTTSFIKQRSSTRSSLQEVVPRVNGLRGDGRNSKKVPENKLASEQVLDILSNMPSVRKNSTQSKLPTKLKAMQLASERRTKTRPTDVTQESLSQLSSRIQKLPDPKN